MKIKERINEVEEKANGEPLDEFLTQQNDGKSEMMTITMAQKSKSDVMMKSRVQKSQVPITSPTFVKHTKTIEPTNKMSLYSDPSNRPQQLVSSKPP